MRLSRALGSGVAVLLWIAGCSSGEGGTTGASGAAGAGAGGAAGAAAQDSGAWPDADAPDGAAGSAPDAASGDGAGGTAGGAGAGGAPDASTPVATCGSTAKTGDYCGNDKIDNGDPGTLYTCAGPGAPTKSTKCSDGCVVAPAGSDDYCKIPSTTKSYRLPWTHGVTMKLTQDCNDACCNDHVGSDEYAWDWANGGSFVVRAARAGTITHMKLSSTSGGASSTYSHYVNMIVIDHGDGTQATYMHLKGFSAKAGITCGAKVVQGQALADSGTTGHSTGIHLHFQVSKVHPGVAQCECGTSGTSCAADWNPFPNVWVSSTYPSVPISFEEWPSSSQCANRRITMPQSLN